MSTKSFIKESQVVKPDSQNNLNVLVSYIDGAFHSLMIFMSEKKYFSGIHS